MACVHLKQLYKLCQEQELKIGSMDVVRLVCNQCNIQEVCPSMLADEYDAKNPDSSEQETTSSDTPGD